MRLNIPNQTIKLICPSCENTLFPVDENEIATCETCGLKLHKDELIEQNNLLEKLDTNKLVNDLTKEMKKIFKGRGWK